MQDNAGQQYLPGFWCGVPGGFVQAPHMAYSSASDVKSFAFLLLLSDSSHCDFIPGTPIPLALASMW